MVKDNDSNKEVMNLTLFKLPVLSYCFFAPLFTFFILHHNAEAKTPINIPYSQKSIDIDGELTDEIWLEAQNITLNIVTSPWLNKPSPVQTTAKIVEDGEYFYIAFNASDPNPSRIQSYLGDRDSRWDDDLVGIKLDTYNNHRLNYQFFVNPHGIQHDRIANELTGDIDSAWDGLWQSVGKITDTGYQVEIAIPYHILNFAEVNGEKTWSIEFLRLYPRDNRLRISHIEIDRNNDCWACQMPEIKGFKNAKPSKNFMLTPTLVATKNENRDIFDQEPKWDSTSDIEPSLDIRWGINSNTLLNVTLNPDFSNIESDVGQLSVNKTFSLFFDEKRPFFVENADYFSTDFNLVYTRNIADPDYGAKLTGTENKHTYAAFIANDTQTNINLPGNTRSTLMTLSEENHSGALTYRYDINDNFSVGMVGTIRESDSYHNYVSGLNIRYRLNDAHVFKAQLVYSNTQDANIINNNFQTEKSKDKAYKLGYEFVSERWQIFAEHSLIGEHFRADLGFMPRSDYKNTLSSLTRIFYGEANDFLHTIRLNAQWQIKHNENNELIDKNAKASITLEGPKLSYLEIILNDSDKVGLKRYEINNFDFDDTNDLPVDNSIDGNTSRFNEQSLSVFSGFQPFSYLWAEASFVIGDRIDFSNDRLGDYIEASASTNYNITTNLELNVNHTYSNLAFNGDDVFTENLTELRVSYQFNINSFLKLNLVYTDIDYNLDNNPSAFTKKDNNLSSQLIYAYKINPQTVFYLGYSDNRYQDDSLRNLTQNERTLYSKISYAWLP